MIAVLLVAARAAEVEGSIDGELRYIGSLPPEVVVDPSGTVLGQSAVLDQRLRAGGSLEVGAVRLSTQWDLLTGQVAGDTWSLASPDERDRDQLSAFTLGGVRARDLSAAVASEHLDVQLGLTTSRWGLGMLANDGAQAPLFGRTDFGDRVLRLRATGHFANASASPLHLTAAVDRVVADELAVLGTQEAWQGVVAGLLASPTTHRQLGLYAVQRWQREADPTRSTSATVLDSYGVLPLPIGDAGWALVLAAEGAVVTGATDKATTYEGRDGLLVRSGGVAAQTRLVAPNERATFHLRGAYASGDADLDDGVARDFTFDRDYDVGMVMFDEVQAAWDVGTWSLLTDPADAAVPPDGVDDLPSEGAFERAVAVQPVVQVKPVPWLDLRAGMVFAWSPVPVANPYTTFRAGGEPRNQLDQPTDSRALGTELDWAVAVTKEVGPDVNPLLPRLSVQGGHLILARDLAQPSGRSVDLVMATASLAF
ncbi:MAG: hypothetical protein H6735_31030 [Alphaproteobacteria bacterium]|nr:hypothetical protein [Alphaproteobacteria bacterium]